MYSIISISLPSLPQAHPDRAPNAQLFGRLRSLLSAHQPALGLGVRQARTADIALIAEACGFDWLFVDLEHGSMSLDDAATFALACLGRPISAVVRVPSHLDQDIHRALDIGASGILIPHVDNAEQAQQVAAACRFPPRGHRSVPGALPQVGFSVNSLADSMRVINDETLVFVMLESQEAITNARQIAEAPEIDGIVIGAVDLSVALGIPGDIGHHRLSDCVDAVVTAARGAGKVAGIAGVQDAELLRHFIGRGMQLVVAGGDLALLMAAGRERTRLLRKGAAGEDDSGARIN